MSCCAIDQSDRNCVDLSHDDSGCAKLAECCAGISDAGLQRHCLNKVRDCRRLGNAWDAIGPLTPMDTRWLYVDAPGYTTQGQLVREDFGSFAGLSIDCIVKSLFCGLLVALLIKFMFKKDLSTERIIGVTMLGAVIQCMLKTLKINL